LGACEGAPAVMVDDEHVHNVTPEKFDALVADMQK
jgi:NADH:ubiquinone oxidoreductase subunit E